MKISFISTFLNEESTITQLLESLLIQTCLPDEIILVDGGSTDNSLNKINEVKSKFKNYKGKFLILVKKGNRSVGRNFAISKATGTIIVCSDAGNILDKNWIKNITKPFIDKSVDVVAGYYKGKAQNVFQKCLIPYILVMPDRINPKNFLPATRSVAFKKLVWEKAGKFNEKFSHNEDYVFAKMLKSQRAKTAFAKDAIVYWLPRTTLKQTYVMFYRFAYGDMEARIYRPKVLFLFIRYLLVFFLLLLYIVSVSKIILVLLCFLVILYIIWSITKNYKYVHNLHAFYLLPLIQFIADASVIDGSMKGFIKNTWNK